MWLRYTQLRMRPPPLTLFLCAVLLASCVGPSDTVPDGAVSTQEECNNIDDDGDGTIDEDESGGPLRRDCSNGCGTGREECEGGEWKYCSAPTPLDETCNGEDDDCDGQTDEGCDCRHGQTRECGIAVGVCEPGVEICENGVWGECLLSYNPDELVEICNDGLDNDCDNDIDEDCTCVPGTTQPCGEDEGECTAGQMLCLDDSTWGTDCNGEVGPENERCDGLDNNCDGRVDFTVSTDLGWITDEQEPNETCDDASPLYNEDGLAQLVQDGSSVTVSVDDPAVLTNYPSLYLPGDEDWYYTRAVEGDGSCIPLTNECSFVVRVQLELLDHAWMDDIVQNHEDYRLCIVIGDCSQATEPSNVRCTHAVDWDDATSSYYLNAIWGGTCARDDSMDIKIQVHSPSGLACGYYQLAVRFYYDSTIACP